VESLHMLNAQLGGNRAPKDPRVETKEALRSVDMRQGRLVLASGGFTSVRRRWDWDCCGG
jgi:hypothetical protein